MKRIPQGRLRSLAGLARSILAPDPLANAFEPLEVRRVLVADLGLSLAEVSPGGSVTSGQTLSVPVIIVNIGDAALVGEGSLSFFASTDNVLDDTDTLIATQPLTADQIPGSGGAPSNLNPEFQWPSVAAGTYFVIGRLNTDAGADANPADNIAVATNTLTVAAVAPADLTMTIGEVTPTGNVTTGQTLSATATIANIGAGSLVGDASLSFFASTDNVLDDTDTLIATQPLTADQIPGPGGVPTNPTSQFQWPNVAAGTYFVIARLNTPDGADSNPANNIAVAPNTLTVAAPADLTLTVGEVSPGGTVTVGQVLTTTATIGNIGAGPITGDVSLSFFASADNVLDENDRLITTQALTGDQIPGPGASVTLNPSFTWPGLAAGSYFVIARVNTADGADANLDNNVAVAPNSLNVIGRFFTGASPLFFTDADGTVVRMSFEGRDRTARGELIESAPGVFDVAITGTNSQTFFRIVTRGGGDNQFTLNNLDIDGSIRRVEGGRTDLTGDMTVTGSIREIIFDDATGASITIGGGSRHGIKLFLDEVTDLSITSEASFDLLVVTSWQDTDGTADVITAPSIHRLFSRDDFGASLDLSGRSRRDTLHNADIKGDITGGTWNITGDVGDISARGIDESWSSTINSTLKSLRVHGDMGGTVAADVINRIDIKGDVTNAMFLAGANLGADGALGGTDDNADTFSGGVINSIHILGQVTGTTFAAGVDPVDGIYNNGNDTLTGGRSRIGKINIGGDATDTIFIADDYPERAKIGAEQVLTDEDPRFVKGLPGDTSDNDDNDRGNNRDRSRDFSIDEDDFPALRGFFRFIRFFSSR